jgi:hypothetical protein
VIHIITAGSRRWLRAVGCLPLIILLYSGHAFALDHPWLLRKNVKGIIVHTRPVDGSRVLEFKASVTVNAPLGAVIAFFEDEQQTIQWYHNCVRMQLLEDVGGSQKIFYFILDLPWPVARRDVIFRRTKSIGPDGVVSYELTAIPDRLPRKKGHIRVDVLTSVWRFTPVNKNQTAVFFQQHSRAGGSIPAFIANAMVVDVPFFTLRNFRAMIEKRNKAGLLMPPAKTKTGMDR